MLLTFHKTSLQVWQRKEKLGLMAALSDIVWHLFISYYFKGTFPNIADNQILKCGSRNGYRCCAHLIMQVHLGPTGEEKLYHISMTPDTGPHVGSHAILRNRMRLNSADKLETDRYTCYKVLTVSCSQNVITLLSLLHSTCAF